MKQLEQSAAMLQHSPQNQNQDEVLENIEKGGVVNAFRRRDYKNPF